MTETPARLVAVRWPNGFRCPACGHDRGWPLKTKSHSFECVRCHRQTSVTAGTLLNRTRLSLTIGSCRSAWMLAAKLRRAMVNPERSPLSGLVEIDEASPFSFRAASLDSTLREKVDAANQRYLQSYAPFGKAGEADRKG